MPDGRFSGRVLAVAAVVAVGAALYVARNALVVIYLAFLLSVALSPAVRTIERHALRPFGRFRLSRTVAIVLLYLVILGALGGMMVLVVRPLVSQARQLWADLPSLVERAQTRLLDLGVLDDRASWRDMFQQAPTEHLLGLATSTGLGLLGAMFAVVAVVFLSFYFLIEAHELFERVMRFVPAERRDHVRDTSSRVICKVSAWLSGNLLLGLVVGSTTGVVLGLIGVPYSYVFAVVAFAGEFIPYIGPLLAAFPAVLIATSFSWSMALGVAGFFLVQQQIENNVLVPKIFGERVGLSAVSVLVAILIGSELLGVVGAILAVPSAAIVQVMLDEFATGGEREDDVPPDRAREGVRL